MRIRYIYSACVVVETPDAKILCDPWFTPGAYDGAWYQYPSIADPIEAIGPVDAIYISHIHPDHYDPVFLRRYLARYPRTVLLTGRFDRPYLPQKMKLDGFAPRVIETHAIGKTELLIVPNTTQAGRTIAFDTALAVRHGGQSVVNLNDNPFDPKQIAQLLAFCPGGRPEFALLPYSGAGPYPQTYDFPDEAALNAACEKKRRYFLNVFAHYIAALDPVMVLPFAGKYWLGGKLARLNPYRGVPDQIDAAREWPDRTVVLADGGSAYYDIDTRLASSVRTEPYAFAEVERHLAGQEPIEQAYEREIRPDLGRSLPFMPLISAAKRAARGRLRLNETFWLVLKPDDASNCFWLNGGDDSAVEAGSYDCAQIADLVPRLEISLDPRYLFGLLTRLYHWNNASVGSQYFSRRVPDVYRPGFYEFLEALYV